MRVRNSRIATPQPPQCGRWQLQRADRANSRAEQTGSLRRCCGAGWERGRACQEAVRHGARSLQQGHQTGDASDAAISKGINGAATFFVLQPPRGPRRPAEPAVAGECRARPPVCVVRVAFPRPAANSLAPFFLACQELSELDLLISTLLVCFQSHLVLAVLDARAPPSIWIPFRLPSQFQLPDAPSVAAFAFPPCALVTFFVSSTLWPQIYPPLLPRR